MSRLLYYLFLKPLSLLPLGVLYVFSDILFFLLYYVVPYRKKVVLTNLKNSFPEKSSQEIKKIMKGFYHFLTDLMLETVWNMSLTEKEARRRLYVENPEVLDPYYEKGKDVIIVVGHYNSWEFLLSAFNMNVKHRGAVIYTKLTNKFLDKVFKEFREKFGTRLVTKVDVKHAFQDGLGEPMAMVFGSDQAPASSGRAYWTTFLNQETAVAIGVEKYAIKYDLPVFFGALHCVKRGYYMLKLELLIDKPLDTQPGEITESHVKALERLIIQEPKYWLWSHKRWKRVKGAW
ncbi:MAG: lysophospholipid acyltransferase family protein [Cyclobacteriaceae bacterium]|nr:lysophospholipid acyltransferase family protein [Cyclobacteriaceae bacterium]